MLRRPESRIEDLEIAASAIGLRALEAARSEIAADCTEYLRWAEVISSKVESASSAAEQKKLAKALALIQMGYLPTKPSTCPFCIECSPDRTCQGCGYARTHGGRCDQDTSAFSRFIEAFNRLGAAIYQDSCVPVLEPEEGKAMLHQCIDSSKAAARKMQEDLPGDSTMTLMQHKACYIGLIIGLLPLALFSDTVCIVQKDALEKLRDYW